MGVEEKKLIPHHARQFVPNIAASMPIVTDKAVFLGFVVISPDYPIQTRDQLHAFTLAIAQSVEHLKRGAIEIIPEDQKADDHICRVCVNLRGQKCRLK